MPESLVLGNADRQVPGDTRPGGAEDASGHARKRPVVQVLEQKGRQGNRQPGEELEQPGFQNG